MRITLWSLLAIYVLGFVGVVALHAATPGLVTVPLVLMRAAVWPVFIATGRPHGRPLGMD